MKRTTFIKSTLLGLASTTILPPMVQAFQQDDPEPYGVGLVKEFVSAGHKDLVRVKELLEENPNLIYSKYDWGNGDFEEAIGGAGHLGNKEIAEYLISKGARVNLFILTMLGQSDLVIPVLEAYPDLIFSKGPHGFTMLHHALVGDNGDMADYLRDKGLTERHIKIR